MSEKDLKKMSRSELLDKMAAMRKELDELKGEEDATAFEAGAETVKTAEYRRKTAFLIATYIAAAISVIIIISAFFMPVYKVTGQSMAPTLEKGSIVLCSKYGRYDRGDVVAVNFGGKVLIKRIIGISGDVISIDEKGNVTLNGSLLDEPYLGSRALGECDIVMPYTVPENRVFVMGDDRSVSIDSRSAKIGSIADEFVLGKVFFRLSPFGKVR